VGAGLTKVLQLHGGPGIPDSYLQPYCLYNVVQRVNEFEVIGNLKGCHAAHRRHQRHDHRGVVRSFGGCDVDTRALQIGIDHRS